MTKKYLASCWDTSIMEPVFACNIGVYNSTYEVEQLNNLWRRIQFDYIKQILVYNLKYFKHKQKAIVRHSPSKEPDRLMGFGEFSYKIPLVFEFKENVPEELKVALKQLSHRMGTKYFNEYLSSETNTRYYGLCDGEKDEFHVKVLHEEIMVQD